MLKRFFGYVQRAAYPYLLALDAFYKDPRQSETLTTSYALNERSFQIFRDEKFLASDEGRSFLQRIALTEEVLGTYRTTEPFFYVDYRYSIDFLANDLEFTLPANADMSKERTLNALVIENKDTFFSLKKCWNAGQPILGGIPFQIPIYGEGRKIVGSFPFIHEVPGTKTTSWRYYYFGDLDPEGLDIYGTLAAHFPNYEITPCTYVYEKLLDVYGSQAPYGRGKKQRLNPVHLAHFLSFFSDPLEEELLKKRQIMFEWGE
ncbi:MAG: Wadjet anti-phage system protein JetD domain-containing protein [Desulfitobacteriaceae bacterium]